MASTKSGFSQLHHYYLRGFGKFFEIGLKVSLEMTWVFRLLCSLFSFVNNTAASISI